MRIGRYELIEKLGEGAMGTVFRALDPLIERTVAIKTIPLNLPEEERKLFEDRFLREARSAGKLSHPNIVTIYDVGETNEYAYIAMEYLDGMSLREIIRQHGPLPIELALDTAQQMALALAFAHDHGIVHRDVKPPNVIVSGKRAAVKLTDFGIAHLMSNSETRAGMLMGSPRYMSPEQVQGQTVDGRSDIFSLGIVLHEMLTGLPPFGGDELHGILFRIVNEPAPLASRLRPDIPSGLDDILARCLAKRPQDRYQNAHELSRDLGSLLQQFHQNHDEPIVNPPLPGSLKVIAFGMPVIIAIGLALGLIVITFILDRNQSRQHDSQPSIQTPQLINITNSLSANKDGDPTSRQSQRNAKRSGDSNKQEDFFLRVLDKKLATLKVKRTELLSTYTELHPDVVMLDRQIEQLEDERRVYLKRKKRQNN
ncbi:MAG: protein kinase [Hydrogenophilaceae bacterium]|nr:protein kinase [Hydrogenophilaceae bacterium]